MNGKWKVETMHASDTHVTPEVTSYSDNHISQPPAHASLPCLGLGLMQAKP